MAFQPGQSGNPGGRPRTLGVASRDARKTLAKYGPALIDRAVQAALAGNVAVLAPLLGLLHEQTEHRHESRARRRMSSTAAADSEVDASESAACGPAGRPSNAGSPGESAATESVAADVSGYVPEASAGTVAAPESTDGGEVLQQFGATTARSPAAGRISHGSAAPISSAADALPPPVPASAAPYRRDDDTF